MITELLSPDNPSDSANQLSRLKRKNFSCRYAGEMRAPSSPTSSLPVQKTRAEGELALIRRIRGRAERFNRQAGRRLPGAAELQLGIGDDCAVLRPRRGEDLVVTTDFTLEGRHFRRDWHPAASAGHRTLARGLSDLAAMGARPMAAFLSLALPRELAKDHSWVDGYLQGLFRLARQAGVPLAGGDTAEAPGNALLADIVLLGAVGQGKALRRDGAAAGDRIYVTGALGGAAAELSSLASPQPGQIRSRGSLAHGHPQLFPEPRLACGQALVRRGLASAAIDLSDGLSTDLRHLGEASGLGAEIEAARLPLHRLLASRSPVEALALALHGGEDYELLFTADATCPMPQTLGDVKITEIGRMVSVRRGRPRYTLVSAAGKRTALPAGGWEHLR